MVIEDGTAYNQGQRTTNMYLYKSMTLHSFIVYYRHAFDLESL